MGHSSAQRRSTYAVQHCVHVAGGLCSKLAPARYMLQSVFTKLFEKFAFKLGVYRLEMPFFGNQTTVNSLCTFLAFPLNFLKPIITKPIRFTKFHPPAYAVCVSHFHFIRRLHPILTQPPNPPPRINPAKWRSNACDIYV